VASDASGPIWVYSLSPSSRDPIRKQNMKTTILAAVLAVCAPLALPQSASPNGPPAVIQIGREAIKE
jgi:hypothetical protein